jgi:hypothetical protein
MDEGLRRIQTWTVLKRGRVNTCNEAAPKSIDRVPLPVEDNDVKQEEALPQDGQRVRRNVVNGEVAEEQRPAETSFPQLFDTYVANPDDSPT